MTFWLKSSGEFPFMTPMTMTSKPLSGGAGAVMGAFWGFPWAMTPVAPNTIMAPVNPARAARKRDIDMVFSSISGRQRSHTARPTNEPCRGNVPWRPFWRGGSRLLLSQRNLGDGTPGLARFTLVRTGEARFDQHLAK